ncbi:MAG: hypothetical protein M3332_01905 [Actinomycetota bacterium]|nr:hypothetical protein [Actinomycetota bacterium]
MCACSWLTPSLPDFENLLFLGEGAEDTGKPTNINETARVEWIAVSSIRDRIARGEIIGAGTQIGLLHILASGPTASVRFLRAQP